MDLSREFEFYGKASLEKKERGSALKIFGCLLVAVLIQTTLVQQVPQWIGQWLGHIDWLLLVTVYIGLQRDPIKTLITGTVSGLMQDSFSGGSSIGVAGLAYVMAGYVAHRIAAFIVVENLLVRFVAVAAASVVNTGVRLIFYRMLQIELPVLAGGRTIAAALVLGLFANLIASIVLFIPLDRIFKKNTSMRVRRSEARRRRL